MNIEHCKEQMEAMRNEFQQMWRTEIKAVLIDFKTDPKDMQAIEHACWMAFKAGKESRL